MPLPRIMADGHPANRKGTVSEESLPFLASFYSSPIPPSPTSPTSPTHSKTPIRQPPLPLSELESTPSDIPEHCLPSIYDTNGLAPEERARAYASAARHYVKLETPNLGQKIERIAKVKGVGRLGRNTPHTSRYIASAPLPTIPDHEEIRDAPSPEEKRPRHTPQRLVSPAPLTAQHIPGERVPGSPVGNAWSGEHYWAPKFSPQMFTPRTTNRDRDSGPEGLLRLQKSQGEAAYYSVQRAMESMTRRITLDAQERGFSASVHNQPETELRAARTMMDLENAAFGLQGQDVPHPPDVTHCIFDEAPKESLAISSWEIRAETDLADTNAWMRIDPVTSKISTILDAAKKAHSEIRERKKAKLDLPLAAWPLVHAVSLLKEKEKALESGSEEGPSSSSSSDVEEYGFVLKSIQEEIQDAKRKRRESEKSKKSQGTTAPTIGSSSHTSTRRASSILDVPIAGSSRDPSTVPSSNRRVAYFRTSDQSTKAEPGPSRTAPRVSNPEAGPSGTWTGGRRNVSQGTALASREAGRAQLEDTPDTANYGSLGRGFNKSRRDKGKAPSLVNLQTWAEEMKRLQLLTDNKSEGQADTTEKKLEQAKKDDDKDEDKDGGKGIGLAVTKD